MNGPFNHNLRHKLDKKAVYEARQRESNCLFIKINKAIIAIHNSKIARLVDLF